ncbi:alpha/beta hydrolase [Paraeggerthella hongkongensis]|uniref:alpha/beta fold hydrolase n=1 Tax=Paraeggerthella sp. TaxID=2897350 RepID=UPI000DF7E6A0|nr:alpha/beta hydrolase [Paraeggerthella hongkongensis]
MDVKLHYREQGSGAPLILLHGNGEDSTYFEHQIERFSRNFRVIALDTRGHGRSPRGSAPFTIRQFADDLLRFMDAHAIERAHVLGFSDGGNIALTLALAHPDRVDRLVLNGANLNAAGVKRSVQIPIELGYRAASLFARWSRKAHDNAEMLGLMVNDPNIDPRQLSRLDAPTLVIAGTDDMIEEGHTRLIAKSLPDARLTFVPGDHFVAAKNPEAFNREVERFLLER